MGPGEFPLTSWRRAAIATVLALGFCCVHTDRAAALDPARAISQYGHRTWTDRLGLPGQAVYDISQTQDGYLFLRTGSRLVRFDGARFTPIDLRLGDQLIHESAKAIHRGADNQLIIRTNTRTMRVQGSGAFTEALHPAAVPDGNTRAVFESSERQIWVGSDCAVFASRKGTLQYAARDTGLVHTFLEDGAGDVWVGAGNGLLQFHKGKLLRSADKFAGVKDVHALAKEANGDLWIGTSTGLFRMSKGQSPELLRAPILDGQEITALALDRNDNLWVGTNSAGLMRVKNDEWQKLSAADGLSSNRILSIYEDREGSLWVGTSGGLDQLRDTKFITFTGKEGLPDDDTYATMAGRDGSVYVSTPAGLAQLRNGTTTVYTTNEGLQSNFCTALYEGRDGMVWIGTGFGLCRLKEGRLFAIPTAETKDLSIFAIGEDELGIIATTSANTYFRVQDDKLVADTKTAPKPVEGEAPAPRPFVFTMCRDASGRLWYGTSQGLYFSRPGVPSILEAEPAAPFPVTSIYDDGRGYLWLTGRTPGIVRFHVEERQVVQYTATEGLADDEITRALCDKEGNLWASTPNGIFRVNRQELDDVADGNTNLVHSIVFGTSDGMRTTESTIPEQQPAGCVALDGKLWFATRKGVVVVDPSHWKSNVLPPSVVVERVAADGEKLSTDGNVVLSPGKLRLTIHYTSMSLVAGERIRFKYRLEGLDNDWVEAGTNRIAEYTHLPPGSYRFRVSACNDDGEWNEQGTEIGIELKPYFYQTISFYVVSGLSLVVCIGGGYWLRVRGLHAREQYLGRCVDERTQALQAEIAGHAQTVLALRQAKDVAEEAARAKSTFLANMSHEIRTPLNGVCGMCELLLDTPLNSEQRDFARMMRESAKVLLRVINDILDFSKIEAGRLEFETVEFDVQDLLGNILKEQGVAADRKGLELAYHIASEIPDELVGDPVRLRQILTNLIGNAIKFTERGEVIVRVEAVPNLAAGAGQSGIELLFSVRDTGIGIPAEKQALIFGAFTQADSSTTRRYGGTGLGLAIASQLVALMGGSLEVDSVAGQGTRFYFSVRLGRIGAAGERPTRTIDLKQQPVLIVDDNASYRAICVEILESWRMKPTAVASGQKALEELQRAAGAGAHYSLVLLDSAMPEMDGFTVAAALGKSPSLAGSTVMMLSSADRAEGVTRCRQLGIDNYLFKPIKPSELLEAVVLLSDAPMKATASTLAAATSWTNPPDIRPLRIVLAEDNKINQQVAMRLLTKWGHSVTICNNGRDAIDAVARDAYDVVLMDMQMPIVDGLTATAEIRALQGAPGHIPIVALTAHAMNSDRERCLTAGMDAYLSKPIRANELAAVLVELFENRPAGVA